MARPRNADPIARKQKEVLTAMGEALCTIQLAERAIRMCMTYVLQKDSPLTIENLEQQQKEERWKTLGYFLRELRKRVDVDPRLDDLLGKFLDNRNTFIHSLYELPGWSLDDAEGLAVARSFASKITDQAEVVIKVFLGLIAAWGEQNSLELELPKPLQEINRVYKPLVNVMFSEKE